MKSIDTQLLLYALNEDCAEFEICRALLEEMTHAPSEWVLADQVLLELYRLLRNPVVLSKPLSATQAGNILSFFDRQPFHRVGYQHDLWPRLLTSLAARDFPARRCFDMQLAHTLLSNGVDVFYTRNTKDFQGFKRLVNPLA